MKHLSGINFIIIVLLLQSNNAHSDEKPLLVVPVLTEPSSPKTKSITKTVTTPTPQINPYLQKILQTFSTLPPEYQPTDPAQALKLIRKGYQVLQSVDAHNFFDACAPHNITPHSTKILKIALNGNDEQFWKTVHADELLQHELKKCNVLFTRENFLSTNYNILFRIMYARIHIATPQELQKFQQAYQQAIIALQWYLFSQAILQDGIFTSGMITIPDPEFDLFNFMNGYAELVSPCYRFYSGLHPHSLWQTQAYTRKSSHWTGQKQFNDTNFGIDLKDEKGAMLNMFPCNKSHLLFGLLSSGLTFVKWEEYGTTINFKEKDFSAIKHTMRYFQKRDKTDDQLQRREKIPNDVMLQFRSLYPDKLTKYQSDQIATYGIKAMLEFLDPDASDFFVKYLITRKKYNKETIPLRKGNEVVLQPRKFVSFS